MNESVTPVARARFGFGVLALRRAAAIETSWRPVLIVGVVVAVVTIAPLLSGLDPLHQQLSAAVQPPSARHLLGTDQFGRDVLARVIAGARTSLYASLAVVLVTLVVGILIGALAAVLPGVTGRVVSGVIDFLLGVPGIIVALAVVGALGPGTFHIVVALGITGWSWYARLAEEHSRQLLAGRVVGTARVFGVPPWRNVIGHVIPHVVRRLLVVACLDVGSVVLAIAGLSYLGLGAQPPSPELGQSLHEGQSYVLDAPWLILGPCAALVVLVLPFVIAGERAQGQGVRV